MNSKNVISIFALLWISALSLSAQVLTSTSRTISKDTTVATISKNTALSAKAVNTSGQVVFTSNTGYVRVLLTDDYGYDLLIYESTPLTVVNGVDNFGRVALETFDMPAGAGL